MGLVGGDRAALPQLNTGGRVISGHHFLGGPNWGHKASCVTLWHGKFELLEALGRGGMGTVYRARQLDSGELVALKTLNRFHAQALYDLKAEFRVASSLHHANLVCLYQLYADVKPYFLTMELIEGVDLYDWLGLRDPTVSVSDETESDVSGAPAGRWVQSAPIVPTSDLPRLIDAAAQICEGLATMHAGGLVHRDLKPGNVRVTPQGRAVLLDFGLSRPDLGAEAFALGGHGLAGTPSFLAPEVVAGAHHSAAADMYALGVLLYRALTGSYPHPGHGLDQLRAKLAQPAADLAPVREVAPPLLAALVEDLLAVDVRARPTARQVLTRLTSQAAPGAAARMRATGVWSTFVGRHADLEWLHGQWQAVKRENGCKLAVVAGESGMGKTALARQFSGEIELDRAALVLRSACLASEIVPFPALDAAMDAVSDALLAWPEHERAALTADAAVAVLFPVLRRIPELNYASALADREVATAAWVRLMNRLAARQPLLLWIDDAQWADIDSAAMVAAWLGQSPPPRVLVLATQRPQPNAVVGFLPWIRRELALRLGPAASSTLQEWTLSRLADRDAMLLLGHAATRCSAQALVDLLRDTHGHPYLLCELAQQLAASAEASPPVRSLPAVLSARWAQLDAPARHLLLVAAAAELPLRPEELLQAAGQTGDSRVVHGLVRARLLRWVDPGKVVIYHHALQSAVLAAAGPTEAAKAYLQLAHAAVACVFESDEPQVAHFFRLGGDGAQASVHALASARQAVAQLAFDAAARHFARARADWPQPWPLDQLREEALSLALSGQAQAAAEAYCSLAQHPDNHTNNLDLAQAAALWIGAGDLERGQEQLSALAHKANVKVPQSKSGILADALWVRARLGWQGLDAGSTAVATPQQALQLAVCRTASECYGVFHAPRALAYQTRYLQLAYASGSRRDLLAALQLECLYLGSTGRFRGWVDRCRAAERELGPVQRDAADATFADLVAAYERFLAGDFSAAAQQLAAVDRDYAAQGARGWPRNFARTHHLISQWFVGAWLPAADAFVQLAAEFQRLGNVAALTSLLLGVGYEAALLADNVALAKQRIADAILPWRDQLPLTFAYLAAVAEVRIALYQGDIAGAAALLHSRQAAFSAMHDYDSVRVMHAWLRAMVAVAMPGSGRSAKRAAAAIAAEPKSWGRHLPCTIACALALAASDAPGARRAAAEGVAGLAEQGLLGYAAGLRWLAADATGDAAAANSIVQDWRAAGVAAPERWRRLFAPVRETFTMLE